MTTTARGRIPRLICASCISSALLISAGATTAIAATQSPAPVQQIPRDDSGGSSDTGDQSGSGSDTGNQPSDTGGSGTGDHQPSGTGGSGTGDQSGSGSDTGNQPSDTGGSGTGDHQPSDTGGSGTGNQQPSDTGGGSDTHKQTGKNACENGHWVDGSCIKNGTISVPNQKPEEVPKVQVPPAATQTGKCFLKVFPATGLVNDVWTVTKWINATEAWVKNSQTGDIKKLIASASENTPGPVGKISACGQAVSMIVEGVKKNPQGAQQILADIKKQTEKLLKNASETPAAVHNFACSQAKLWNASPSVLAQLKCA